MNAEIGINIAHMFENASTFYIIEKLTIATEAFSFIYFTIGFAMPLKIEHASKMINRKPK